ncbi:cell surface glycoprotein 1-like [Palaemon carinicauda]|uniref:cell surface glycoprotein 1-like n=1 Tax=Palaemon carinicauda TaxID=392227 RepID=UPI0035B6A32B
MRGRYQGRVVVIEQPMPRYQRPIYMNHRGRVIGFIWSLPIIINSGVFAVLLITGGILMIVFSQHGDDFQQSSNGVTTSKNLSNLLPGGIVCLVIGVICLIVCISLIIFTKKRYRSVIMSSHLQRHVMQCSPPYRDEDQISSGRHSRVLTSGTERTHGLAPVRRQRSSRGHTLDGHVMEYPTSQNVTPVGYTNGTSRAPIRYLRSTAVYPSQYPTSERQRFSYIHASNGQPYFYDFPTDELHSRRPPSLRRSTYPQLERPSRDLQSPSEQHPRYPLPHSEVISNNRSFGDQPLHNLTGEKISSRLRYPPSVGKNFSQLHSSNGQTLYYDFSKGEVLSQRLHSNGEATRIHSPPRRTLHDVPDSSEQQPQNPSPSKLSSNNPVNGDQPLDDLSENPLSPPPTPEEQTLHMSHDPEEESLGTSHFAGDARSINTPGPDEDNSINPLAEVEALGDTAVPNEGPSPNSPFSDKGTSENVPSPHGEPSDDILAPNDNPSDTNLAPDEEPSNTPILGEEASITMPAPTEEPLGDIPALVEEPIINNPAPDAEGSNNSPAPDELVSGSTAGSDVEGSVDTPVPNEDLSGSTLTPDEEPSNNIPTPDDEPSSKNSDPVKELSSDTSAADEKDLSSISPVPEEEKPSSNTPVPKEELLSNAPAPEEEASNNVPVPEEEPLNKAPTPKEEPLSNAAAPEEGPSNNEPVPEEEPLNNAPAPEEEPVSNAPAPKEEPISNAPAPEEEPSNNVPVP